MLHRLRMRPEFLFLLFALPLGALLCFLVPPFGGGNEMYNFQRVVSIAYGHMRVETTQAPAGFAALITEGGDFFHEDLQPPFHFGKDEWKTMVAIPLDDSRTAALVPAPAISIHHPFSYIPQAFAVRLGAMLKLTPLTLFYLARVSGFLAALALTFIAIRRMPSHAYILCALALLPPITFSRSCIDADPVTNGLAFLFTAQMFREITADGTLRLKNITALAVMAFVLAQCKSVYFFLPLLAFAIPKNRFTGKGARRIALAVIILPGLAGIALWLSLLAQNPLLNLPYHTWAGDADPGRQASFVLHHPFDFALIFLRTLFTTAFFPQAMMGVLGAFGPPVSLPLPAYVVIILLLFFVMLTDATKADARYSKASQLLVFFIFAAFLGTSMTAIYVDWTGLGKPLVEGFQGRYLYPMLPSLLVFIRPTEKPLPVSPAIGVVSLACAGLGLMLWTAVNTYYG